LSAFIKRKKKEEPRDKREREGCWRRVGVRAVE